MLRLGDDGAVLHSDEVIGDSGGEVQLVQHHDHGGAALLVEVRSRSSSLHPDVPGRGRWSASSSSRMSVSGERHGNPDTLTLAAGEFGDLSFGEGHSIGGF